MCTIGVKPHCFYEIGEDHAKWARDGSRNVSGKETRGGIFYVKDVNKCGCVIVI